MDLLSGLRKGDTSRGGRAEFSWEQVKDDKDRENYLGHSLMAPVGRWQRGKDLTWYAKGGSQNSTTAAEDARKEEIQRIKEAEQDALSEALGFKVERRHRDPVDQADVTKVVNDSSIGNPDGEREDGRGIGYGKGVVYKGLTEEASRADHGSEMAANEEYRPAQRDQRRQHDSGVGRSKMRRKRHIRSYSPSRSQWEQRESRYEKRHGRRSRSRDGYSERGSTRERRRRSRSRGRRGAGERRDRRRSSPGQ